MEKSDVETVVENNPGITFTMLRDELGAANGQLQYHLRNAEVKEKGRGYVKKGTCEDCSLSNYCEGECIRRFLLEDKKKRILELIDKDIKKTKIAEELSVSPATLSYHIKDLKEKKALMEDGSVNPEMKKLI